jgi:UDP-4-amino-4-deoxy-L-arabinose-oxoglutarate aminotransferase
MNTIEAACGRIPIIEDAAHAVGTFYKGKHIGAKNLAVFSFHPIKNITTAEGGMITGGSKELLEKVKLLKFHGIERDAWKRYGKASDPSYDIEEPAFKYNLTDIQAALGIVQLGKIIEINEKRTRIARHYLDSLSKVKGLDLPGIPAYDHVHSWHLFVVKSSSIDRKTLMAEMAERNIGYGLHFPACHTLKYVKKLFGKADLPETEAASERILSIPLYPSMEESQVQRVIAALKEIFG